MPSLRQVLAAHAPLLVIDAASSRVQVGWLEAGGGAGRWAASEEESGIAIFRGIEQLGVDVAAAGAFVFCDGPGSILGIRTVAMALRAWTTLKPRPIFAYTSLAVVAHAQPEPELTVIADARRDAWHTFRRGHGLHRLPTAGLAGALAMPEGFRHWTPLPPGVRLTPYSVGDLLDGTAEHDLLRSTSAPDAFLHEEPSYVTWTPQIHRAQAPGLR
ncbi:MAG TPA: peptidase M22 [Opitutaceae bacterium]